MPRSGTRPPWIVVAGWRTPTANNNDITTNEPGESLANGHNLHQAREGDVPPANNNLEDRLEEQGGRAADARQESVGRAQNREAADARQATKPRVEPKSKSKGRKTKAGLLVGSINLSGRGEISRGGDKWSAINQLLRERRIGILAIQETHLDDGAAETIKRLYGRRIHIVHSADPNNPTAARGVAIVLNREIVDVANVKVKIITPGRAIIITTKWHAENDITIMNVYAPNSPTENEIFWKKLEEEYTRGKFRKPDLLAGDFNIVEEAIDRIPAKDSQGAPLAALKAFLRRIDVYDGWRLSNPSDRVYSFPQRGGAQRSRLDRIYATDQIINRSLKWDILTTGVPTDHCLVTANITAAKAPNIGKGRWTMPLHLMLDHTFIAEAIRIGERELQKAKKSEERTHRSESENPQIALKTFKTAIRDAAQRQMKRRIPKLRKEIARLTILRDEIQNQNGFDTDSEAQNNAAILQERILTLERKRHGQAQLTTATHYDLNGEKVSKYWSAINKERQPQDLFFALRTTDGDRYETRSDRMSELARNYHDNIQRNDIAQGETEPVRKKNIANALASVDTALTEEERSLLSGNTTRGEIETTLKRAGTGKAAGLDGIPYEFWSKMDKKWKESTERSSPRFDCIELLRLAYNDFEENGPCEAAGLAEGWMCPLYKKKDRREIENYRPITLLNSDYKTYTKILATRLSRVIHKIVHPDQAGFIPNRQISNQTQLCRTMVDYAEATEENGVIVALDQEKAYDKIAHDYLWETLRRFGLPDDFINKIRSLYKFATTVVILNGNVSSAFLVIRGVRQGDPLSCLIFDIAIEPLACALRKSQLQGFQIPGASRRLIASLFADDTSAFLAATDKWSAVWSVIGCWCRGSRARFNAGKTEVIPIGSSQYRDAVWTHRTISGSHEDQTETIPDNVHIAREGEAVRVLGAWIGNGTDQMAVWAPTVKKVKDFLKRWKRCHPSMAGKRSIVQMGPGGITQYLTMVQGMPKPVEKELTEMIRDFMWDGRNPAPVSLDAMCRPVIEGGLGLLDVKARNTAIEIMWVKRYLTLSEDRPLWALAADALFSKNASKDAGAIRKSAQVNSFLQAWTPSLHKTSKLPGYLKEMLAAARKCEVSFAAIKLDTKMKKQLPIWYHLGATKKIRKLNNKRTSDCLRDCHGVRIVADASKVAERPCYRQARSTGNDYLPDTCTCKECTRDREQGCKNPWKCCQAAEEILREIRPKWHPTTESPGDNLTLTKRRNEKNEEALTNNGTITFNPSVTQHGELDEAFRAFVDPSVRDEPPTMRRRTGRIVTAETCVMNIVASTIDCMPDPPALPMGTGFADCVQGETGSRLAQMSIERERDSPSSGVIVATLAATLAAPRDAPLHFVLEMEDLARMLLEKIPNWENEGWIGIKGASYLKALMNQLRQRCAPTTFRHATMDEDKLAIVRSRARLTTALKDSQPRQIDPVETKAFKLSGAKLSTMTQALAYRGIRERTAPPPRTTTTLNIAAARDHLRKIQGADHEEADIWHGLRNRDIRKTVADFLWKGLHGALRVGTFWTKIPKYEGRAQCQHCQERDSLEHILTECRAPGQQLVWRLTARAWEKKGIPWNRVSINDILTIGPRSCALRGEEPTPKPLARLWRIMVSESAHLIWRMRCERVIGHADDEDWQHSQEEIAARWMATMNSRLRRDVEGTDKKYGRIALKGNLVSNTWRELIANGTALPEGWIKKKKKVLVGIDPGLGIPPGPGIT